MCAAVVQTIRPGVWPVMLTPFRDDGAIDWTEGSYLLPDMRWGYGYLRAVRNVFGRGNVE